MMDDGSVWEPITHDDALLWLNDRVGAAFHVEVTFDKGDLPVAPMATMGTLSHWREDAFSAVPGHPLLRGLYLIEGTAIDVTHLATVARHAELEMLRFDLTDDVHLEIVKQTETFGA